LATEQQLGRILETVNSDNNKNLTRRSHRRVFFFSDGAFTQAAEADWLYDRIG